MHKAMKEYVKREIQEFVLRESPTYTVLKSAAIGGGLTFREKRGQQLHLFLVLEFIPQRERFKVSFSWSKLGRTPQFADLESLCGDLARREKLSPEVLFERVDEGCVNATAFGKSIDVIVISPSWVPWRYVREAATADSAVRRRVELLLGDEVVESLLSGAIPPLGTVVRKGTKTTVPVEISFSWEQWFADVLSRAPSEQELRDLLSPSLAEAKEQIRLLLPFASTCN